MAERLTPSLTAAVPVATSAVTCFQSLVLSFVPIAGDGGAGNEHGIRLWGMRAFKSGLRVWSCQ